MSRPVTCSLLLVALVAAFTVRRESAGPAVAELDTAKVVSRESVAISAGVGRESPSPMRSAARAVAAFPAAAPSLTPAASAVLAEQVALQLLARDTDLALTDEQWTAFAEVSAHYQAIRHAYEATIATATRGAAGGRRLEIPIYAAAGDALRARFVTELREKLGAGAADQIEQRLGAALDGHFAGFGVSMQTLEFTAGTDAADSAYQVTRTIKYWNSRAASAQLSTRRETHFPGLEDPSGHTWGPFLSVLAASATRTSS